MKNDPLFEVLAEGDSAGLAWPTISIDKPKADQPPPAPVTGEQDVWAYLTEHVEEFEVAKAIVDFVEANPKLMTDRATPVDLMGLHLLAKVSLKRKAVLFAQEQAAKAGAEAAVARAREQSRSLVGVGRRLGQHLAAAARVVRENPSIVTLAVVGAWILSPTLTRLASF